MNTRLVLWGEIGTDRKALVAIYLEEETAKIHIYAFPKEQVTKEVQDALFVEWKNGGEYEFPETAIHWEVDANSDTILPEDLKVDRPEVVLQSQHKWGKKLMGSRINQLLADETKLLEEKASSIAEYDQSLWDKAKAQWEKIASYQKRNEISWEQTTVLKEKINAVFDTLKAVKRINSENEDQANSVLVKQFYKRVEELQSKLIYSDQWKFIFEELKKIQQELKDAPIRWNHKRTLYNNVNTIFDDLRKYRMTEVITKTKGRISQLSKILDGLKDSITRDHENYNMQVEKMQHYTRGKLPVEEIKSRFSYIFDRIKEKEVKADGIKQTIQQLKNDIEKEKKQQEEREQQRIKREQEHANKKHEEAPEIIQEEFHDPEDAKNETDPSEIKESAEKPAGKRTHTKRTAQKVYSVKDTGNKNVGEETVVPEYTEASVEITPEEVKENVVEAAEVSPSPDTEAEQILSQNNAALEPVLEIEPATPESVKEETTVDAVDEEIAEATDEAKNNPD